jgi:putative transposase
MVAELLCDVTGAPLGSPMGRPLRPTSAVVVITCSIGRTRAGCCSRTTGTMPRLNGLGQACERVSMRLLAYCIMPNHWHLVVCPRRDDDLSPCMNWLALTHTQGWYQHRHSVGEGDAYRGRFTSFPVETDAYLLTVCHDVERNPVRAGLVERAEPWGWSRAGTRGSVPVQEGPMARPAEWPDGVKEGKTHAQWSAVRSRMTKGHPWGGPGWVEQRVAQWHVGATAKRLYKRRAGIIC